MGFALNMGILKKFATINCSLTYSQGQDEGSFKSSQSSSRILPLKPVQIDFYTSVDLTLAYLLSPQCTQALLRNIVEGH